MTAWLRAERVKYKTGNAGSRPGPYTEECYVKTLYHDMVPLAMCTSRGRGGDEDDRRGEETKRDFNGNDTPTATPRVSTHVNCTITC